MIRVRSVIPGRQRWDIGMVLARPQVAEHLEAELQKSPGVGVVRANPVTGRLLVCHDTALSSEKVGQIIWTAVTPLAAQQTMAITGSSKAKPSVGSAWVRRQLFALAGSAVLGLAFTLDRLFRRSQLEPATAATVAGLQQALQQSARAQQLLSSPLLFLFLSSPFAPPLPPAFFCALSSLSGAVSRSP
jgi:ATP-binding cassette, subfamily B, bacterial